MGQSTGGIDVYTRGCAVFDTRRLVLALIAAIAVLLGAHAQSAAAGNVSPEMALSTSSTSTLAASPPTVTVKMPAGATGTVGFYDIDRPEGVKGLGVAEIHDGVATLQLPSSLALGEHDVQASYGGDAQYAAGGSNVVAITVGVECTRRQEIPDPPAGGVVFARSLDEASPGPNVVALDAGADWLAASSCAPDDRTAAQEVMTHPRSIRVGTGGAVMLADGHDGLVSPWGAVDISSDDPAPVLFPGRSDWTTTEAEAVEPEYLLRVFNSCRSCALAGVRFSPLQGSVPSAIAYEDDVSGADLRNTRLEGDLDGWNFSQADLNSADLSGDSLRSTTFDQTTMSSTDLDDTDLDGAHFSAVSFGSPPKLTDIRIGANGKDCTSFRDSDLVIADPFPSHIDGDCKSKPLFPGTSVTTDLFYYLIHTMHGKLDMQDAVLVSGAEDRSELAGMDLTGMDLDGIHFEGFPANLSGTDFDGDSLKGASFELADLAGAQFHNVDASHASFRGANLAATGGDDAANFAGSNTSLSAADFIGADISGVSFSGADLSAAAFTRALAIDTDFNGVRAANADFNRAHIYGDGEAFSSATNLTGADFTDAVLAGDVTASGGFDFTKTDLTGAKFDGAQCIDCNFSGSSLTQVNFSGSYLPGAVFSGVISMKGANLADAWLYCGDLSNSACATTTGGRWLWQLALGDQESYGPVPFASPNLKGVSFSDVTACPNGQPATTTNGCDGRMLPDPVRAPGLPAPCSAAGGDVCPTPFSTLLDLTKIGVPTAIATASPAAWATARPDSGYYVALDDGTVRLIGSTTKVIAGQAGKHCPGPDSSCGDGDPATRALLGTPAGLAVGLDGSVYVSDTSMHRVWRIDPNGQLTDFTGNGKVCTTPATKNLISRDCGDGGPAANASLGGPYGIWMSPQGDLFIADGVRGIREVDANTGQIHTLATDGLDVRAIVGDLSGHLYALTDSPDYLIRVTINTNLGAPVEKLAGTGKSGYNGTTNAIGNLLPGTSVQINHPEGIALAPNGDIVFADTDNNLIRAYVPSSGHVIDLAGMTSSGKPLAGFNDDGHWADQTQLDHPRAVTVNADSLVVVADSGNRRVRQFGPSPLEEDTSLAVRRSDDRRLLRAARRRTHQDTRRARSRSASVARDHAAR